MASCFIQSALNCRSAGCRATFLWNARSCSLRTPSVGQIGALRHMSIHPEPDVYKLRLTNVEETLRFVCALKRSERELLAQVLQVPEKPSPSAVSIPPEESTSISDTEAHPSAEQLQALFLFNTLPFIGFGILDNLLMVVAGEYIDATLGIYLGISTMAAAGFGNILSDIAGVGTAHYVEFMVAKVGIKAPALSPLQWNSSKARWVTNMGRAIGLTIGCLIGMFPLLFFDETEKQEKKLQAKHQQSASAT